MARRRRRAGAVLTGREEEGRWWSGKGRGSPLVSCCDHGDASIRHMQPSRGLRIKTTTQTTIGV
jgi:hypothetical protein